MNPVSEPISIVIPVRNASATVRGALDSIRAQTWESWELVAVDDGSDDDSPSILHSLAHMKRYHYADLWKRRWRIPA